LILTAFYLIKAEANKVENNDTYLENTNRAELFTLTDYNIPDIYINMSE